MISLKLDEAINLTKPVIDLYYWTLSHFQVGFISQSEKKGCSSTCSIVSRISGSVANMPESKSLH